MNRRCHQFPAITEKKKYVTTYLILYVKEDLGGLKCPILSQYDLFLYNKFQLYIQVV